METPPQDIESLLAVQDRRNIPIVLRGYITGFINNELYCSTLHFLTALASICASKPDEEYAASYKISSQGVLFLISGCGPVPDSVRDHLEKQIFPILHDLAKHPVALDNYENLWRNETVRTLLLRIFVFTRLRYEHRMHLESSEVWTRRVTAAKTKATGSHGVVFDALLSNLELMKTYTARLDPDSLTIDDHLFENFLSVGAHIHRTCREYQTLDLFGAIDNDDYWSRQSRRLRQREVPIVVDTIELENTNGSLRHDFSFARYTMNVVGIFEYTVNLVRLARSYSHIFGPGLQLVYCESEEQTVSLNSSQALHACDVTDDYYAPDVESVTAYPHAAVNMTLHIIKSAKEFDIQPVIGCSSLLCAGCDSCITQLGRLHATWDLDLSRRVPVIFFTPGATRKVQSPWVLPRFPLDEKATTLLRERIFDHVGSELEDIAKGKPRFP